MTQQDVEISTAPVTPEPVATAGGGCGGGVGACGCGAQQEEVPVLDVRTVPHAVRHGAVFGSVGSLPVGASLVLVAPHDPLPLLAQLAQQFTLDVAYLERGPEAWALRLTRQG